MSSSNLSPEEEFYKKFFTKSSKWSGTKINSDEALRWSSIEAFVLFVKGFYFAKELNQMNILDLGCGRGWLSNRLSQYGQVMGVEPMKPVVEYANTIYPELKIVSGTSFDLIDQGLKGSFDLIVSSEVIEHVEDKDKPAFVESIQTLLKPNGFCVLTTPRAEIKSEFVKYSKPKQPVEDWISEHDLKALFQKNNFETHLKKTISYRPRNRYHPFAPLLEIYQVWLFQKK